MDSAVAMAASVALDDSPLIVEVPVMEVLSVLSSLHFCRMAVILANSVRVWENSSQISEAFRPHFACFVRENLFSTKFGEKLGQLKKL